MIHHRNIHRVAIEMFKVNIAQLRILFRPYLLFTMDQKRDPSEILKDQQIIKILGNLSFRSFGPVVWDGMLPSHLKECENLNKFKSNLKKWIPSNCYCRLCRDYIYGEIYIL